MFMDRKLVQGDLPSHQQKYIVHSRQESFVDKIYIKTLDTMEIALDLLIYYSEEEKHHSL